MMRIPNTLAEIIRCWDEAETRLRRVVRQKYHDPDEEFITKLFCGEFSFSLRQASRHQLVRKAFLRDLQHAFEQVGYCAQLTSIADNLVADVSIHKRHIEKVTGGDFGLTISRPDISLIEVSDYGFPQNGHLEINFEYQRGLLCQAKLERQSGWGTLTNRQKDIFPNRMHYLGLLLYGCSGQERQHLKRFLWRLCANENVRSVNQWLRSRKFGPLQDSSEIIRELGEGLLGTDDKAIIDEVIRPTGRPQICISVYWPPGKRPPNSTPIQLFQATSQAAEEEHKLILYDVSLE